MNEITQNLLKELFDYKDGNLYWKVTRGNKIKIGDRAGSLTDRGYRLIGINGKSYLAHRLIFLYHHRYLPEFLDHIDGEPTNNDILNLREATQQENNRNKRKERTKNDKPTSSIYKGVTWNKANRKWLVQIHIDRKGKYLGLFTSEIEAAKAYNRTAVKEFGKFAKLNEIPKAL